MSDRLTPEREAEIAERTPKRAAALTAWLDRNSPVDGQRALENAETVLAEDVPALLAEIQRLRAERHSTNEALSEAAEALRADRARIAELEKAAEEIRHLHKDSPMGPCPVCVDADAWARGDDPTVPYPCPTARLAGAKDFDPPSHRTTNDRAREAS